ncbi:MAG TPA: hypothetical protein PKH02_05740 [Bacteroidales bacterium]|nr:hypothetical protein [Bacteroidales bacterium]HPT12348.1 hypothetical protein [Bacteroidales bacterium]
MKRSNLLLVLYIMEIIVMGTAIVCLMVSGISTRWMLILCILFVFLFFANLWAMPILRNTGRKEND